MIQVPFSFKYLASGKMFELVIPIFGEWIPLKPIVEAMGMKWEKQREQLKQCAELRLVDIPNLRGRPPLCAKLGYLDTYLANINVGRVRNPDVVKHFQTMLPLALRSYYSDLGLDPDAEQPETEDRGPKPQEPEPETQVVQPEAINTEIWDARRAEEYLRTQTIFIGQEFDGADKVRADLVAVGVRDYDEIQYIMSNVGVIVMKLDPEDADRPPVTRYILFSSYERGDLLKAARAGFYPIPEFFRRDPEQYEQKLDTIQTFERKGVYKVKSSGWTTRPSGNAPWYSDKFAAKIQNRIVLLKRIREQELSRELAARIEAGEDLFSTAWDTSDYEFEI